MSTRFERFARMAKEQFGLTVIQTSVGEKATFETLFGVSAKGIAQYELPYNIVMKQVGYYDVEPVSNTQLVMGVQPNRFNPSEILALAA